MTTEGGIRVIRAHSSDWSAPGRRSEPPSPADQSHTGSGSISRAADRSRHPARPSRAFLFLAKRHHPDQGGEHHDFLRVKHAYDRAFAVWRGVEA